MFRWLKNHKLLVIIILVALVGGWYLFGRKPQIAYNSYTVTKQTIQDSLELSGKVAAGNSATLRFAAGGLLTYIGAKEGDSVKKWATIAKVDTRLVQKTLEQKLNLYSIQRGTFEQTIDDNNNSVPADDLGRTLTRLLQKNQYQLDNTVKDVEYHDLTVKLASIYTPIAGILIHAPVTTAGVTITSADTWEVVDPTSLYFSADLDETDLKHVNVAQKTLVKLDAYLDKTVTTSITSIGYIPTETSTGTTYEVKVALKGVDIPNLRLGLNGTAAVVLEEKQGVISLPAAAIGSKDGYSYVYLKKGSNYIEQKITTGIENAGVVEITSGVKDGDEVFQVK